MVWSRVQYPGKAQPLGGEAEWIEPLWVEAWAREPTLPVRGKGRPSVFPSVFHQWTPSLVGAVQITVCDTSFGSLVSTSGATLFGGIFQNDLMAADEYWREVLVAAPGTFSELDVELQSAPGATKGRTFTIRKG